MGRGEPAVRAARPRALKARMALRTVCTAQHKPCAMARGGAPCRAQPHDLGTPHGEGAWGTQADVELGALRAAQLTNEDRWVHPDQMRPAMPSHKSYRENALSRLSLAVARE